MIFEETDADLRYEPMPGCCEDCDDALDIEAWDQQLAEVP